MTANQTSADSQSTVNASSEASGKSVTIIFNPVSGQEDPEKRKAIISEALAKHGYTCQYIETSKENGAKALGERAIADGVDLLVVAGGDGTVMEVLSAAIGSDIPVAVVPSGTGNLLSVNLGIPTAVPDAIDVALAGNAYPIDLAKTTEGRHFAIVGGVGLDGRMIRDANREAKKRLGVLAYLWAVVKNIGKPRAFFRITLDGKPPIHRRAKSVMIANMGRMTGGLDAVPTASPYDGLLDIAVLKTETFSQWLRLIGYLLAGRTEKDPDFDIYQARKVVVQSPQSQPAQFDGEDGGGTKRLEVEIVPKAVKILLPEDAPAAYIERDAAAEATRRAVPAAVILIAVAAAAAIIAWRKRR